MSASGNLKLSQNVFCLQWMETKCLALRLRLGGLAECVELFLEFFLHSICNRSHFPVKSLCQNLSKAFLTWLGKMHYKAPTWVDCQSKSKSKSKVTFLWQQVWFVEC